MTLLDRFRTQPPQKHADPVVRLAYVQDIPIDERDLLAEIAREDPDARVRRAAVVKLMDPAALALVARADTDEAVRAAALAMLRDIALDAFERVPEADSLAAVDALTDAKMLAAVARTALREDVALRALWRVADPHAQGSVARHAQLEPVRLAALSALQDRAEIITVALNSEFKDTGIAAVERIEDRTELEQVMARGRNRSAVKRARAILREMDEGAAAAQAQAEAPVQAPQQAAPQAQAEAPAQAPQQAAAQAQEQAPGQAQGQMPAEAWEQTPDQALEQTPEQAREGASEPPTDPDLEARRQEIASAERAAQAALAEAGEAARAQAAVDAETARAREEEQAEGRQRLAAEAEEERRRQEQRAALDREQQAERGEAEARVRQAALARLNQLAIRLESLPGRADLTLKAGERALRDVRAALADLPPLPSRREHDQIADRLRTAQAALTAKVQELRELTDWQRWANLGVQEQLCTKMEALGALEDPAAVARHVRELQDQWRAASDVPRPEGDALWRRFKASHDIAWARCEAHFAAEAAVRAENLVKKTALCEKAEALADSTSWIPTAEEIKRLQLEWKSVGVVTRGHEKATWERFRTACDHFFTRRQADLAEHKKRWAANLEKKLALCAQAEALADSIEWDAAAAEIKRLQSEWKAIGPVKKSRSEAIWQRFRGACDRFFARYAQRHEIARGERVAAREAICAELEALVPPQADAGSEAPDAVSPPERSPEDVLAAVRALRTRWQHELAARGVDRGRAAALDDRFAAAFSRLLAAAPAAFAGTELDADANRKRMEALVRRIEDLAARAGGAANDASLSPTTRAAAMLKEALAANTIGGKVDEDSRTRAAAEDVRQAQASWARIGPVPDDVRRALADRFARACRRIGERAGAGKAGVAGRAGMAGGAAGTAGGPGKPGR